MKQILIAKEVAYLAKIGGGSITGVSNMNELADGALAIFTKEGVMVNATASNIGTAEEIYFARGSGDATKGAYLSELIPIADMHVLWQNYAAPVNQVIVIGADNAGNGDANVGTIAKGDEASMRIIKTNGQQFTILDTKRYSYTAKTGDTEALVLAGLVDKINADTDSIVVAAMLGVVGFSLTTKDPNDAFTVTVDDLVADATVLTFGNASSSTIPVASFPGFGTPAQITALESEFSTNRGNTKSELLTSSFYSKATDVDSAETYAGYAITWQSKHVESQDVTNKWRKVIVPYPDGATIGVTNLDAIFDAFVTAGLMPASAYRRATSGS